MEKVKTAYQKDNLPEARSELLKYFQYRTNRKLDGFEFEYDREKADRNVKNIFRIKSSTHDFGDKIDWTLIHEDKEWQFSLNRMNWFSNYVGVYQQTKDEKYVYAWMEQIKSWIQLGNPGYPRTIDTGRRLQNWIISYWMFVQDLKSPSVSPEFHAMILQSIAEQAEFSYQPENWRRYSNWGTFENAGLSLAVILFPEFRQYELWNKEIWFRMRFQLEHSYHEDGMHVEVSPPYHAHELEVWFDFVRLAKKNGIESSLYSQIPLSPIEDSFLQPAKALMNLYKPTGVVPQIGDTDERDERTVLYKWGKFWNWPDMIYVATDGREGNPPVECSAAFPDGGYYVMRSGWGNNGIPYNEELYLLFDCGSNEPWHAHYDMLNLVVTAYGQDLLKDPGRFTYNEGKERDYFKSTAAHNTIVIDEQNQPRRYTPPEAQWHSLSKFDYVVGVQNSHPQVTHRRSVFFAKPDYWIVVDRLLGRGKHRYDQYWHLSDKILGDVSMEPEGKYIAAPNFHLYSLLPDVNMSFEEGWLSYNYRHRVSAPVIRCSTRGEPPITWATVLYPFRIEAPMFNVERLPVQSESEKRGSSCGTAVRISSIDRTDLFFEQEISGHRCGVEDFETDARMAFVRFDGNRDITEYQMVEGSCLKYRGRKIASLLGSNVDISVQNNRVDVEGECIVSFQLMVQNTPEVFLDGQRIEVERKDGTISFSRIEEN
ncbi:MAG: alginate lyase family protein [Gemmatimonadota bacterium]|nr:MAG: alginate lyase family protein [Gemmatimonadota bacterium]